MAKRLRNTSLDLKSTILLIGLVQMNNLMVDVLKKRSPIVRLNGVGRLVLGEDLDLGDMVAGDLQGLGNHPVDEHVVDVKEPHLSVGNRIPLSASIHKAENS